MKKESGAAAADTETPAAAKPGKDKKESAIAKKIRLQREAKAEEQAIIEAEEKRIAAEEAAEEAARLAEEARIKEINAAKKK
jgi:hypothetical protein